MSLVALVAAAALRLVDPTGDAAGDGTLVPPTSPVYANAALFDLQEVALTPPVAEGEPTVLRVSMGALELDDSQAGGFSRVVVDVYIDFAEGGAEATLSGPNMLMPLGRGWDYAVRINPSGAFGTAAPLSEEQPVEWSALPLQLDGDTFVVSLPLPVDEDAELYAVSGLYDAFAADTWRTLTSTPSPWSFSGEEQTVPVLDVLAADNETQVEALRDGVLPAIERPAASGLPWLLLAMAGVLIAATGLWLRRLVAPPAEHDDALGEAEEQGPEVVPADDLEGEQADGTAVEQTDDPEVDEAEGPEVDAPDPEVSVETRPDEAEPEVDEAPVETSVEARPDEAEPEVDGGDAPAALEEPDAEAKSADVAAEETRDAATEEPRDVAAADEQRDATAEAPRDGTTEESEPSLEDELERPSPTEDERQRGTRSAYSRDWNFEDEEEDDEDELAGFGTRRPGRLHVESSDEDA